MVLQQHQMEELHDVHRQKSGNAFLVSSLPSSTQSALPGVVKLAHYDESHTQLCAVCGHQLAEHLLDLCGLTQQLVEVEQGHHPHLLEQHPRLPIRDK